MLSLTMQALQRMLEDLYTKRRLLEIQIGKGQSEAFGRAMLPFVDTERDRRKAAGNPISPPPLPSTGSLGLFGIPLREYDLYPPGVGLVVESCGGVSYPAMLLDWQKDTPTLVKFTDPFGQVDTERWLERWCKLKELE